MTAQDLKKAILQLAVQGKLVPQNSNDESASALLKRIMAENAQLRNKRKAHSSSEDEVPFDIPESWEWVHLNQIASSSLGKTMDKAKNSGSECPYLCSINVYWEGISFATVKTALFTEEEKCKYALAQGDLLICEGGDVGRTAVWESDSEMYYQNALHRVRFYDEINPYYFRFVMEYYKVAGIIDQYSKGQAIKHLVQSALYSIWMPLPPIAEQKRIVTKIEELMPFVEEYGKEEGRLSSINAGFSKMLTRSILQEAIQGKLTERYPDDEPASELLKHIRAEIEELVKARKIKKPKKLPEISEDEIPFDIPEEWKWVRLGEIILGVADGPHFSPPYYDEGIPFISTRNVAGGKLDFSTAKFISPELHKELSKRCKPKKWDVLYTKGGTTGIAAVNDSDVEFNVWVHVAVLSMGSYVNPYYLAIALNSPHCYALSQEYTHGTSNRDLGLTRMVKITLPLPPFAEQQRIVDRVNDLLAMCDELR